MSLLLSRLGRFSARHRLLVLGVWLVLFAGVVATFVIGSTGPGPKAAAATANSDTPAAKTLDSLQRAFPQIAAGASGSGTTGSLQLVFRSPKGSTVTDPAVASAMASVLRDAADLPGVAAVSDPFARTTPYVSKDGRLAVATLSYTRLSSTAVKQTDYDAALRLQQHAPAGVRVELGGNLLGTQAPAPGAGEALGVLAALLVLLITFGSLLAAGANLLVAFFGVGLGALGVLAYGRLFPLGSSAIILAAMLGLAVGIDYSLFILTRFRGELREGRSVEDAVARAVGTAGTAVVFAGLTVIIALVGLFVVGTPDITQMGVSAAVAVAIAVLIALTLLPVALRTLGRRVLPRKERRVTAASSGYAIPRRVRRSGFGAWATGVTKHPVLAAAGAVVVLLVVAAPTLTMRTAYNIPGGTDPASTQRTAYNLVLDEFGGRQSPLLVLAHGNGIATRTAAIGSELASLPGVLQVTPAQVSTDGTTAFITVIPNGSPIADSTRALVPTIRNDVHVAGVTFGVTGEAAIYIDEDAKLHQALITYVVLILLLSLVLLTIMFRSLLIPVVATLGYLLSLLASFGGSVAVFQWGWLDPLIAAPQGDPMLSLLPIILCGVLFGLAMDYQVFLTSRIQEAHAKGASPKDAIVGGFRRSAPVLVAAGSIMAVVFAGFASSPMAVAASIAFGLVVGVVADVFLVRLVLMPALLSIFGKAAWWLPRWLDRLLPDLDIEGRALDEEDAETAVPLHRDEPALTR